MVRAKELVTRHPRSGHLDDPKTIVWRIMPLAPYTGKAPLVFKRKRSVVDVHVATDDAVADADVIVQVVLHYMAGGTRTVDVTVPIGDRQSQWVRPQAMYGKRGDWLTATVVQGSNAGAQVQVELS